MILYIYPKFLGDVASLNGKIRIQKTPNKGETAFDCNGAGNSLCEQHFSPDFTWFEVRCLEQLWGVFSFQEQWERTASPK